MKFSVDLKKIPHEMMLVIPYFTNYINDLYIVQFYMKINEKKQKAIRNLDIAIPKRLKIYLDISSVKTMHW